MADGGRDPGLPVGEGVLNEAVRGAGVDGVGGHHIGFIGEAGAGGYHIDDNISCM